MALSKMKILSLLILALSLFSLEAGSSPLGAHRNLLAKPVASPVAKSGSVFDVTTFGAKSNGKFDNTQVMIKAWNAACKAPGSAPRTLLFPAGNFMCGEVVWQGPCNGPMTVEIRGTLTATSDLSAYTQGVWIEVQDIKGVTLTGGGTLDGKGEEAWPYAEKNTGGNSEMLPVSLQYSQVTQGSIKNIKILNSKGFQSKVTWSTDITVSGLTITAPDESPNTDGLHISSSTNVNVTNMHIGTGDDCVSIGEGSVNIFVSNVTCGPGHGISIGSLGKRPNEKNVNGVKIVNCTLINTTNGARIKTFHDSPKISATNILYENIVMNGVTNPILIDQHYFSKKNPKPSNVQLSDIKFRNIRGTSNSPVAVTLNCSEAVPCQRVELTDINLSPANAGQALTSTCFHTKPVISRVQNIALAGCGSK